MVSSSRLIVFLLVYYLLSHENRSSPRIEILACFVHNHWPSTCALSGCSKALQIHFPLPITQGLLVFSYYLKLSATSSCGQKPGCYLQTLPSLKPALRPSGAHTLLPPATSPPGMLSCGYLLQALPEPLQGSLEPLLFTDIRAISSLKYTYWFAFSKRLEP